MRIGKLGSISFCKTKEIKRLQKELKEAQNQIEQLREVQDKFQEEVKKTQQMNVSKIRDLIVQAKELDCDSLEKGCNFPVYVNYDKGVWCLCLSICWACGSEFDIYEFESEKEALEFGYILSQLGGQLDSSHACSQCYDEYIQAGM